MNPIKSTSLALAAVASVIGLSSVYAASDNGTATATVITPISIVANQQLSFGAFAAGTGGTVVIGTDGSRSNTGGVVLSSSDAGTAGTFDVSGQANATYAITLPSTDQTITDGGVNSMVVNTFQSNPSGTGTLSAGGTETINVGATLTVSNGQATGTYTGTYAVSVEYN